MSWLTGTGGLLSSIGFGSSSSNTNSSSNFNQNGSGTSTSQLNLTPYQSALQGPLYQYITSVMQNPQATVQPFLQAANNNTNANYNGLSQALAQQFMSTSGGASGKFGTALAQGNLQRIGQLSNNDTSFAQTAAQLPLTAAGLAQGLLSIPFSSTTSGSTSTTGSQSGQSNTSSSSFHI